MSEGKVALVVGGTRGIGGAVSRRLAAAGAAVAMLYQNRAEDAARIVAGIAADGGRALAIRADVAGPAALAGAIDEAVARFGRIDILVFSAGLTITGPLADYAPDAFDRVFAVNVRAPFLAAQKVAAAMGEGGRIILIGSVIAERTAGAGATLYAASKSALAGMVRGLARDLGPRGITANLVQPGPIATERNPEGGARGDPAKSPLVVRRRGTPEEVAALVAHLASAEAGYITGAIHTIDGGWSA